MRRLFAVAALATAFFAAGCGGPSEPESSGTGPGSSAAPATSSAAGTPTGSAGAPANSAANKEICTAAEQAVTEGLTTFLTEVGKLISATAANNMADAEKAEAAAEAAANKMGADLRAQAAKATDPAMKQALEQTAASFEQMGKDPEKVDEKKMEEAGAVMEKFCG
jgi:hypothetical protein